MEEQKPIETTKQQRDPREADGQREEGYLQGDNDVIRVSQIPIGPAGHGWFAVDGDDPRGPIGTKGQDDPQTQHLEHSNSRE